MAHHEFFRLVQVNPSSNTNSSGLFSLGSKLRGSGRSERDLTGELSSEGRSHRAQPQFSRVPSQRYSRRSRSEETEKRRGSTLERKEHSSSQHSLHKRHLSNNNLYDPHMRGNVNSLPRNTSMTHLAMQSLPPEVMDSSLMVSGDAADLSMRSLQYLESRGLFGSRAGQHQSRL